MSVPIINSEKKYDAALLRIEALWGSDPDTEEGAELNSLVAAVRDYEDEHHRVE